MRPLRPLIARLSFCGKVGALAGSIAAALFAYVQVHYPLSWSDSLIIAGILSALTSLVLLVLVVVCLRYDIKCVALLTLLSCILASFGAMVALRLLQMPTFALIVGFVVGTLLGEFICLLCRLLKGPKAVAVSVSR